MYKGLQKFVTVAALLPSAPTQGNRNYLFLFSRQLDLLLHQVPLQLSYLHAFNSCYFFSTIS
jgi:hypothetical protein